MTCVSQKNFSILSDLAVQFDEKVLAKGGFKNVTCRKPCHFVIIPRYGKTEDIRFFEVKKTFVLHFLNAYESVDPHNGHAIITLDGYRQCAYDGPMERKPDMSWQNEVPEKYHKIFPTLGGLDVLVCKLWRWKFDLTTGKTCWEGPLDDKVDRCAEFGVINQAVAGCPHRFAYSCTLKPGWFLLTGFVKHDVVDGTSSSYEFGSNRFCSEPAFAPRNNPKSEDDGYLVTFVTDMNNKTSEFVMIDARDVEAGPVCRLKLPHRISSGTHACWCPRRLLEKSAYWKTKRKTTPSKL
mmetsp:Transcript_37219/g.46554  ORF Transcript_37219/g.46554 Transcript_37219/m.46554 type:complete len:294 (-) Transcript_37219:223-1104(-)